MPLKRFVAAGNTYDLSASDVVLETYNDNFAELVTRTQRLPFAHGGFDQLGSGRSLSEIGTIRQQIHLVSETREGMQAKRDALKKMADWGAGVLYWQPTDTNQAERWTRARLNNITMSDQVHQHSDLHQPVTLTWQASDPFWYTKGNGIVWGQGAAVKWGDGTSKWGGGSGTTVTGSGTIALTNNGNAFTLPTVSIRPAAGKSATDPIVRRMVNGTVVDEVRWIGTLNALDYLFIDAKRLGVWLNGARAYTQQFSARNASWLRLLPGSNSIKVLFVNATDEAVVRIGYPERYV